MYQHVFWFYSHPAVYIMMLPGFGIISEVISTHARKPIFGYRMMAFSLVAIVILGLLGLGAPHVRLRHVELAARADDDHHDADRGADRHQDLLLARDAMARRDPSPNAHAVRAGLHHDVHPGRDQRHHARGRAVRHPRVGHLLHRRPHPLRAVRRLGVHDLRRDLPLVPEDDRAGCTTRRSASCTSGCRSSSST